jgi:hypothetical protein
MTHFLSSSASLRLCAALSLAVGLSACGGGDAPVRPGPQAVHPSPSAFAQSPSGVVAPCGAQGTPACHIPNPADGSAPIID